MTAVPGRLLVVDDDVHIRRLIRVFLRDQGYDLVEASTADEALKMSKSERFDVVLFNPPYYRGVPRNALDHAWRSPDLSF